MTTVTTIRGWLEHAIDQGATHMLVVCDTFDMDNYPVYVAPNESARKKVDEYHHKDMQGVIEVYDLSLDIEMQLQERRAWHC